MSRRVPFRRIESHQEEQAELDARSKEYASPYRNVMRANDRATGEPGAWQRPHRRTFGHARRNRQQVARGVARGVASIARRSR